MRKLLIFFAAVIVILLGLWGTLVLYFDEARLKQIATEQVRAQTGRELRIDGPLELDVFPSVSLVAREVSLSGPEGYQGPDLFSADEFRMSLALLPLISGRIETGDIRLAEAELNVHTDRSGRSSLDGLTGAEPADDAPAAAPPPEVSTGRITLSGIRLNVTDAATDAREVFLVERLNIDSFRFDEPFPFEFAGSVGDPATLRDIELDALITVPSGAGAIRVDDLNLVASASGLALGLGGSAELNPGPPLVATFRDGRVVLGEREFDAGFTYRDDGRRARIEGELSGAMLDVDALLAALPETAPAESPPAEGEEAPPAESPLLLLRDMDVDAQLALDAMRISGLDLSEVQARLRAEDGIVEIDPLGAALSGGRIDAVGMIDLTTEPPQVRVAPVFDLESLGQALAPWGLDRFVTGAGLLDLELNASGLTPGAVLASLDGQGQYNFRDGTLRMLDFGAIAEAARTGNFLQAATGGIGGTTAFETLEGVLEVSDGTIRLPGIKLVTEALGIQGDARIGLADLSLDGQLELTGTRLDGVPIGLTGTLLNPKPDAAAAARRVIEDEVRERVGDRLRGLLGGSEDDDGGG